MDEFGNYKLNKDIIIIINDKERKKQFKQIYK